MQVLTVSHISSTSRIYFTSKQAWRPLNAYNTKHPFQNFVQKVLALEPREQQDLKFVWRYAATVYTCGSADKVDWKLLKKQVPSIIADTNKYCRLGLIIATAVSFWRKDIKMHAVNNFDIMLCTVQKIPSTIRRAGHELRSNCDIALDAFQHPLVSPDFTIHLDAGYDYESKCVMLCTKNLLKIKPEWSDDEEIAYECSLHQWDFPSEVRVRD